jgi:hypothetical protein
MRTSEVCTNFWSENTKGRDHFGNLDEDGKIILKLILKKWNMSVWMDSTGSG